MLQNCVQSPSCGATATATATTLQLRQGTIEITSRCYRSDERQADGEDDGSHRRVHYESPVLPARIAVHGEALATVHSAMMNQESVTALSSFILPCP